MEVYTIGFTKKTAEEFFQLLKRNNISQLVDIRLNNSSQLAGFTKKRDLSYFLNKIGKIDYVHEPLLAPTSDMLKAYKNDNGQWEDYEVKFIKLMRERKIEKNIDKALFDVPTVLLCSEHSPKHCHRRLIAEYLKENWGDIEIKHL